MLILCVHVKCGFSRFISSVCFDNGEGKAALIFKSHDYKECLFKYSLKIKTVIAFELFLDSSTYKAPFPSLSVLDADGVQISTLYLCTWSVFDKCCTVFEVNILCFIFFLIMKVMHAYYIYRKRVNKENIKTCMHSIQKYC